MTYKAIVQNMVNMKAGNQIEQITDRIFFTDYNATILEQHQSDAPTTFDVFGRIDGTERVRAHGLVSAYGTIEVTSLWTDAFTADFLLWTATEGCTNRFKDFIR